MPQAPHRRYGPPNTGSGLLWSKQGRCWSYSHPIGYDSHVPPHGLPTAEGLKKECWKHGAFTKTNLVFFNCQFPLDNWGGWEGKESVPWLLHSVTLSLEAVNGRHLLANGESPGMTDGDGGQHSPKT